MLVERGERVLADRWRAEALTADSAAEEEALFGVEESVVRGQVVAVLSGAVGEGALGPLAPATSGEIGRTLHRTGHDALVYLVGGGRGTGGYAVVVDVRGGVAD